MGSSKPLFSCVSSAKIYLDKKYPSSVIPVDKKTTDNSVNAILDTNKNPNCESDYDNSVGNMVACIASFILMIEPKNRTLKIENTKVALLIDSGSVCSILNESLATEVINISSLAQWHTTPPSKELKTFAKEPIPVIGMMLTPVESNDWRIENA